MNDMLAAYIYVDADQARAAVEAAPPHGTQAPTKDIVDMDLPASSGSGIMADTSTGNCIGP
jgi:hypothetical protein